MTDKPEKPETPGMAEAMAKFEHKHAADTASTKAAPTTGKTKIQLLYQQALGVLEQFQKAADRDDGDPDRIYERFDEVREQIMETPATCPQDVAVKLRLYVHIMDIVHRPDLLPEKGDNAAEVYLRIAICDLERLDLRSLAGADVVLEKLAANYHAACEAGDHAQEVLDGALPPGAPLSLVDGGEKEILVRMLGIDAEGLRGVRAKVQAMFPPFAWERFKGPDTSMFDPLIDHDMLRSVVVDLERLASGNTPETFEIAQTDPVAKIGRDLASIWRRHDHNEEEMLRTKDPCPERIRLKLQDEYLSDRADALQNMAPEILATSLEGAMVQIILAHGAANLMGGANLGLTVEQTTTALVKDIHKLLNSALAVLEQETGVSREELGGETYMARSFDPHVVIAETA